MLIESNITIGCILTEITPHLQTISTSNIEFSSCQYPRLAEYWHPFYPAALSAHIKNHRNNGSRTPHKSIIGRPANRDRFGSHHAVDFNRKAILGISVLLRDTITLIDCQYSKARQPMLTHIMDRQMWKTSFEMIGSASFRDLATSIVCSKG